MKENILKRFLKFFFGSDDFELIEDVRPLMDKYNYKALRFSTVSFLPFLIILTISSAVVDKMNWMFPGYLFYTIVMAILLVLSRIEKLKNKRVLILILLYIEMLMTLAFGLILGNFADAHIVAVSYHVFLVTLPLFICDAPWRLNTFYFLFLIPYIYTSYKLKCEKVFIYDFMNGFIYTILGIFVNIGVQINHFESFSNRCLIKRQRDTDTLTGTLTKKAFEVRVQREMRQVNSKGVFMIFDIDNFKTINDTLGHSVGDYFISNTGYLLLNHCRQTDIVGRFGGDEFVIYMPGIESIDVINRKANEFMTSIKEYFTKNMNYENFSVSIGATIFNNPNQTYKEIFDEMDKSLYDAKKSGKNKCCIYDKK